MLNFCAPLSKKKKKYGKNFFKFSSSFKAKNVNSDV